MSERGILGHEILPGAPDCPVILHVPHSATLIPLDARDSILLTDAELVVELRHMTDAHTDVLARAAAREAGGRPWQFVNRCSRLVVDPERFPDEREEMVAVGMGAVYTATSHRTPLRDPDPDRDRLLIATYFDPYAHALAELVDQRLAACGRAVIIDVHSYPAVALPYEQHGDLARPPICLGVDDFHTPDWLADAARDALSAIGECLVNEPFRGTYVPLAHHGVDPRVASIMIEIRRDVYCGPDLELGEAWIELARSLGFLLRELCREGCQHPPALPCE
ncbi:MAG: N-formylglutamate amidohydrolase [Candidatus Nanopelagicales bacterium]